MSDSVQKYYTLHHFRAQCGGEHAKHLSEDSLLAPMFDVVWKAISDAFKQREFALFDVTDAMFLEDKGHFGRGQWVCVINGLLIRMTPVFTDMNVVTNQSIHMTWNILVEGDDQRVNAFLIKIGSFVRQYMATMTFATVHAEASAALARVRPDLLSRQVRAFYKLRGI